MIFWVMQELSNLACTGHNQRPIYTVGNSFSCFKLEETVSNSRKLNISSVFSTHSGQQKATLQWAFSINQLYHLPFCYQLTKLYCSHNGPPNPSDLQRVIYLSCVSMRVGSGPAPCLLPSRKWADSSHYLDSTLRFIQHSPSLCLLFQSNY